ncbi:hypothetical protein LTR84_006602 [Exophiala bonariae]|uniref:FAD/NAD(P)-binding domain-containing protein n=1 Tax=Exophiala bonariae TaxID=1690606 RepID=A0AAV9N4C0_9EURO|nr:hypothetical protein LTR84_006602 [Exophiala bonariae]
MEMQRRVLIVGAGFAGVWSALAAKRLIDLNHAEGIEVTVVAPEPRLVLRPRLYEADTGVMSTSLTELFDVIGVQYIKGKVHTIDALQQQVKIRDADGAYSSLSYSRLVLAAGSCLLTPDIPGLREHCFSVDQLEDSEALHKHLQTLPLLPPTAARNTAIVVGGGFTGIEIAAELPARLRSILGKDADVRVVVVDRAMEIGNELGPGPRPVIKQALTELGVEMKLGAAVASVNAKGVVTAEGETIEALTVIWTGGMGANPLTQQIKSEKDSIGRLHVDRNLRVPANEAIFATGDTAFAATDEQGHHAMMSCQHAIPLGRAAGYNAAADLLKLENRPYMQPAYGTCLDLGPWGSVICDGWERNVKISGPQGKAIKQWINGTAIYPPKADKAAAFASADPDLAAVELQAALAQFLPEEERSGFRHG